VKRALLLLLVACGDRGDKAADPTAEPVLEPMTQQASRQDPQGEDGKPGYIGVLAPRESAEIVAPFTSSVAEMKVRLGDKVDKGQALARLDDRPLKEQLAIDAATLKATQAQVAQADIERKAAHANLDREQRALKDNVVSQAEVSAAEFADRKATMAVAGAAASVEEQRAKIAKLKARLVDTTLVTTVAGNVALLYAQQGDRVEEGHPVIRVISGDELYVKFAIPADKLGTVKAGDEVDVAIEDQNVTIKGIVRHVAPELDPVAQMILADAELPEPPGKLQGGIMVRITPKAANKR
jgi:RND family efflux transporter MFP subunit